MINVIESPNSFMLGFNYLWISLVGAVQLRNFKRSGRENIPLQECNKTGDTVYRELLVTQRPYEIITIVMFRHIMSNATPLPLSE